VKSQLNWTWYPRGDGRTEWLCPDGIGHGPHPHGCDGCCARDDYPGKTWDRCWKCSHLPEDHAAGICIACPARGPWGWMAFHAWERKLVRKRAPRDSRRRKKPRRSRRVI
jgi:hypothetical protein